MGQDFVEKLISELEAVPPVSGLIMTDILDLPDSLRRVVHWILRKKHIASSDLAGYLSTDTDKTFQIIDLLTKKGFLEEIDEAGQQKFHIRTSTITHTTEHRKPPPNLWDTLGEDPHK